MILQLSCTDDGYTGHSLSQVSRFYQMLTSKPPNLRRIRYLCILHDGDLLATEYGIHSNWDREICFSFSYYEKDTSGVYNPDSDETEFEGGDIEAAFLTSVEVN